MDLFLSRNVIKIFVIFPLFFTNLILTGCWDRRELNDTAIVLGASIDKAEGRNIKLTVQFLAPQAISGQGGQGGKNAKVLARSAIGKDMVDASSKLQIHLSRKLFWGHCKVFIIGDKLAKEKGIRKQVDFFVRHPGVRDHGYLFISVGEASKVLEVEPKLEPDIAKVLRKISDMHIGVSTTVKDIDQMLVSEAGAAVLPLIKMVPVKKGEGGKAAPLMAGTAIFREDKMIGQIDTEITRGLLWLRDEIEVTSITATTRKGAVFSIDPVRQTMKIFPTIENGKWKIVAKGELEGTILQNGSHHSIYRPSVVKMAEGKLEKNVKNRIEKALKQVKSEMNVDAFGFADAFHRKYPKEWGKVKDHWDEILPQVDVKVDVKVRVLRTGLSSIPAGLKGKEVKSK